MIKPVITLKKVKTFIGHDGIGLSADVYVDGIKTFYIFDGATGGESDHTVFNKVKYKELEVYVASLPARPIVIDGIEYKDLEDNVVMMDYDIDQLVDEAHAEIEKQKAIKKRDKKMETCVLIGVKGADEYSYYNFKRKLSEIPKDQLDKALQRIKSNLKEDEIILNNNL